MSSFAPPACLPWKGKPIEDPNPSAHPAAALVAVHTGRVVKDLR